MITFVELQTFVRKNKFDFNACALELNCGLIAQPNNPENKPTVITSDKIRLAYAKKESLFGYHLRKTQPNLNEIENIKLQSKNNINIKEKLVRRYKEYTNDKCNIETKNISKILSFNHALPEAAKDACHVELINLNDITNEHILRRNRAFQKAFDAVTIQPLVHDKGTVDSTSCIATKMCKHMKKKQNQARKNILKEQYKHDTNIINEQRKQLKNRFNENSIDSIGINPLSDLDTTQICNNDKTIRSQSKEMLLSKFLSPKDILMNSETMNMIDQVLDEMETESDMNLTTSNTNTRTSEITNDCLVLQSEDNVGGSNVSRNNQVSSKKDKNLNNTISWAFNYLSDTSQVPFPQMQTKMNDSTQYNHEEMI